jgi:TM2 domain-containing membrane protein YozV
MFGGKVGWPEIILALIVFVGVITLIIVLATRRTPNKQSTPNYFKGDQMYCRNCGKQISPQAEFCMNCGARPLAATAFCPSCGAATNPQAAICIKCGVNLENITSSKPKAVGNVSPKSRLVVVLLAFFVGQLGIHRFYVGKIGSGIGMLLLTIVGYATIIILFGFIPLAAVWIWNLVDFIMALAGAFKDKDGKLVTNWEA